ncbi:signal peptide peptidase SppA [Luteolibacter ambystomatis]|uniref:Signal peptide peptidase SppA n=1 Tax=Luteolibacter ambystomatis TaxID=2824561 RepID=A0A975G7S7_9BACT|nr:signal peptide peptidase SppA [Luteolibacter ambystomatis]QUE50336.1 signal peptide peptidase SppA [Luteolibacter ambystomatis]
MRALPLLAASVLAASAADDKKPIVAVYDLNDPVTESGKAAPSLFGGFDMDASRPLTTFDITRSLEKAAADPQVKAVVLDVAGSGLGLDQIQEVRRRLLAIRTAGKDVWIYSESLGNGTAILGSAANHFTLLPEADCEFSGIHAESMYFKGLLDKVGVQADVIHIGDFKSFGENYYRTGPSEPAQQQEEKLIDSIYNTIVKDVAAGRKLPEAKVKELIDRGELTAAEAKQEGLADDLLYRTTFNAKIRETYGADAEYKHDYQLPERDGPEITGMMDIIKLMFSADKKSKSRKDYVAVVALDGDISDESIAPVREEILKLRKDEKAKALVLRVNSPGGSALASEVLWEATSQWKSSGRPFIVSMGGVAASGGYYVSSGADRIFAESGTITGSIGVVGMKFVVGGAMEKLGITSHVTQRGKNAGAMSMTHAFTPEESDLIRKSMTRVYGTFKQRVIDGRKDRLKGDLEPLAGGRVYSGEKALEIGLVDEIGGLAEAIDYAAKQAKLETGEAKLVPEPKSAFEGIFAKKHDKDKDDDELVRAASAPAPSAQLRQNLMQSGLLSTLPAPARAGVDRLMSRMDAFQHTEVLLLGPDLKVAP